MTQPTLVPAILETDLRVLQKKLSSLSEFPELTPLVHIDICDGKFVPTVTAAAHDLTAPEGIRLEAHLMVDHPEQYFELLDPKQWASVLFHAEAVGFDEPEVIARHLSEARTLFSSVSLVVNPDSDLTVLAPIFTSQQNDFCIQIMGVYPGKSGQGMVSNTRKRITTARSFCGCVAIDGGVTKEIIPSLITAGASKIIASSAIWKTEHPIDTIRDLTSIINQSSRSTVQGEYGNAQTA